MSSTMIGTPSIADVYVRVRVRACVCVCVSDSCRENEGCCRKGGIKGINPLDAKRGFTDPRANQPSFVRKARGQLLVRAQGLCTHKL